MSFLTLSDVSYQYPSGHLAVDRVNMSFAKGESVAIIGQNGAGKTTTVKMMNGLLKPTDGNVIIDGWNTREYTTAQLSRKVGYVFQNPDEQIFHNDVYSEIEFGPKNLGLSEEQIKENVMRSAELTGVVPFLEENPYNLPYSMRKFVTIASVLAMDSSVVIWDEPTAGQDLPAMKRLSDLIRILVQEGKTVITITHDMEFVVNNFNRTIVMANRQVLADGDKRDIFWDHDILRQAKLKQPHISRLCHSLNLDGKILTLQELTRHLWQADTVTATNGK
ncbi:energy-coupling factor ABC transporter ATP-binding protein [Paenibacillus sp. J2TS4]|uniref:energy-coupling factor ABC transporter ATP-binding protein n=1 Tax=Paenibacillus sp. J2TS4 TaxID=2807194 RepID=UPI001B05E1A1|nr:ABC transporter ATP-binding protein [Paenibacillus sp. J2TS4]GIP31972.1 ABC transporter ATP-binding protein [Paenibacillus sp. J2TS4]